MQIQEFFDIPLEESKCSTVFIEHLIGKQMGNFVVVSPDLGNNKMAQNFVEELKVELAWISR